MANTVRLTNLVPGRTYQIQLRSVDGDSFSEWSRLFDLPVGLDNTAPDAPAWAASNEWVVSGDTFIATWQPLNFTLEQNKDFDRYELELGDGTTTKIINTDNTSYTLTFDNNRALFGTPKPTVTARVRAVDGSGNASAWTALKSATNPAPTAPLNFDAVAAVNSVLLSWDAVSDTDLDHYAVYVGTPGPSTRIFKGLANRFTYSTTTYSSHTFTLRAVDKFGQESPDRTDTATPDSPFGGGDTTPPNVPTAFVATVVDDPQGMLLTQTAKATWTAPTPSDITLAGYHIRYKKQGTTDWNYTEAPKDPQQPFVIDRYLQPNVNYDFEIRSFDAAGLHSAWVADTENAVTPAVTPSLTNALIVAAGGFIRSSDYTGAGGSTLGWKIDDDGLDIRNGVIRASTLSGGQIVSSGLRKRWDSATNAYITDTTLPAWVIDLEGDADFNNMLVRGSLVVGESTETPTTVTLADGTIVQTPDGVRSTVASGNYMPGQTGWILRSDGYVEFRNVLADSIEGQAIKTGTLDVQVLKNETTLDQTIWVDGDLTARNTDVASEGYGSTVSLSGSGFFVKGSTAKGNPAYITFPTSGAPNIISGTLQAETLTVSGLVDESGVRQGASFRGLSHFELESNIMLDNAISTPLAAPGVVESTPKITFTGGPATNMSLLGYKSNKLYRVENYVSALDMRARLHTYSMSGVWESSISIPRTGINPGPGGDLNDAEVIGMTHLGSSWYFLWAYSGGSGIAGMISKHDDSTLTLQANTTFVQSNNSQSWTLGHDGTDIIVGHWNPFVTNGANRVPHAVHHNATTLATTGTTVVLNGYPSATSGSTTGGGIQSIMAGEFDYGSGNKTYLVTFLYGQEPANSILNAYDASGNLQPNRTWALEKTLDGSDGMVYTTGYNTAGGDFYHASFFNTNTYKYVPNMWGSESLGWGFSYSWYDNTGRTVSTTANNTNTITATGGVGSFLPTDKGADISGGTVPGGVTITAVAADGATATTSAVVPTSAAFNLNISYETLSSPHYIQVAKKRRVYTVTGALGPSGTVMRVYAGRGTVPHNYPLVSEMHLQATLAGGMVSHPITSTPSWTSVAPKTTNGTFAPGTPGKLFTQQNYSYTVSPVTTNTTTTITGTGSVPVFGQHMVGATVSGTGIQSNTTIVSVSTDRISALLSKNATANNTGLTLTMTAPSIELKGDGFSSFEKIFSRQTILTSTQDVNTNSGNMPPLRIGDINNTHMRIDGNEIQVMSDDDTPSQIMLNQGGGLVKLGQGGAGMSSFDYGVDTRNTNASGDVTIPHNCPTTPTAVVVTMGNAHTAIVTTRTSTNFTLRVRNANTGAVLGSGVSVQTFYIAVAN